MSAQNEVKRRGLVMTGGGAKGLYEAGVLHAFHLVGMDFDVITGSSIGAFNAIFFAEYLLQKKQLSPSIRSEPEQILEAMDGKMKAFHHAWLTLPQKKIIDDGPTGSLGRLKDDLLGFKLCLPDLAHLLWWWTDPDRNQVPSPQVWPSFIRLGKGLLDRLGGPAELLQLIKNRRRSPFQAAIRTYLANFQMERSLIPPEDDQKLASVFTQPIAPLRASHLQPGNGTANSEELDLIALVPPGRRLGDFAAAGIEVRLTRANYRTGRLELSSYVPLADFVRYLTRQAFRLEKSDPEKLPLGSFRLHLPGNPDAIGAALASGRFPGVLKPFPIAGIYPADDPENETLHKMLAHWLDDPQVEARMREAYLGKDPSTADQEHWAKTYTRWRNSTSMRSFFPQSQDVYIDGGAIDNTPSNSAIDATREWAEAAGRSRRETRLDLYVVFLHPEPTIDPEDIEDPAFHQVIARTLKIQSAAKQSSDAVIVDTINTFGQRAENLGDTLAVVLSSYQQLLGSTSEEQRGEILNALRQQAQEAGLRGYLGDSGEGIVERMQAWMEDLVQNKLPLHINKIVIYPDEMPMSTLQFTERLGYRQENAIRMLTSGCSHTLWTVLYHLGTEKPPLDQQDQDSLKLAKKWMGLTAIPRDEAGWQQVHQGWTCLRSDCVFHAGICNRGAKLQ